MSTVISLLPIMALQRSKALMRAMTLGENEKALALVAQGVDLETPVLVGSRELRPLDLAILLGRTPVALALIEARAPVTTRGEGVGAGDNYSPFVLAAKRGNEKVLSAIRQRMSDMVFTELALQRLLIAAQEGRVHEIDTLRRAGADCRRCDRLTGEGALHRSALAGHAETVAYLVLAGCNLETCNYSGVTPADLLRQHHPEVADMMGVAMGKRLKLVDSA